MTNKLLLFATYYLAVALFGPNPTPGQPNQFAIIMLWVSLGFSVLSVNVFLYDIVLKLFPDDEYVVEYKDDEQSIEFSGGEVKV
jgi:hypothetical protein